jgi:magnesium chelatase family protein
MMFATTLSSCIVGLDATPIDVEVTVKTAVQQPRFTIIGSGGAGIKESRDRIVAALETAGFDLFAQVLVNLAPAEIRKDSAVFDLPIALAIACAKGAIPPEALSGVMVVGELSLAGEVKSILGATAHALCAANAGLPVIMVPASVAYEAAVVRDVKVVGVESLAQAIRILRGEEEPRYIAHQPRQMTRKRKLLRDVVGQSAAKRALTIAAAGGHNLLMIGPPGCGKSMLAERLVSLLPPLDGAEILEVLRIHSIAGQSTDQILAGTRPFRMPHHVVSDAGLIGGGMGPRPGEVSLAHRGVLFMDEFPEFRRSTIEGMRSPLEFGSVQVARAKASVTYPARFQLIAAMNPCPCGRYGSRHGTCRCSHHAIREYLSRLSQPILDRIDLHVELESVGVDELIWGTGGERVELSAAEADPLDIVLAARERQLQRFKKLNGEVSDAVLRGGIHLTEEARTLLGKATQKLGMSARGYMRVLRVATTIADIDAQECIDEAVVAEAVSYRSLERLSQLMLDGTSMPLRAKREKGGS